jgi:hypothetical protein
MRTHAAMTRTMEANTHGMGLTGQLVVGGTVSMALLLGGYAVGFLGLIGGTSGHAILVTSFGLFLTGALVGLVLSTAVGLLGREQDVTVEMAAVRAVRGALYAIPALAVGALLAGWIAMAVVAAYLGKLAPLAAAAVAAVVAAVIILATARLVWEGLANATRRVLHPA